MAIQHKEYPIYSVQFHPEFTSNPREGHPLFTAYVKAAIAERDRKATAEEKAE